MMKKHTLNIIEIHATNCLAHIAVLSIFSVDLHEDKHRRIDARAKVYWYSQAIDKDCDL